MSTGNVELPKLTFCELLLRDGIQGWPDVIATKDKLTLLHAIDAAGVAEVDVTSFVPAHVVPQFADSEEVLKGFTGNAKKRVLTVNRRGVEGVIHVHQNISTINTCGMPFSASEAHNLANLRCDHVTHKIRIGEMVELLLKAGVSPMVCVATAWGCPISGPIESGIVRGLVSWLRSIGVKNIMLGDTTGMANPSSVSSLFSNLINEFPDVDFIAHFHDNRGCAIANVLTAIESGVRAVDGCLGGLGGEPSSVEQGFVGESGNVVSEDLVGVLMAMGYQTDIDLEKLMEAGALAEFILNRPLFSKLQRLSSAKNK